MAESALKTARARTAPLVIIALLCALTILPSVCQAKSTPAAQEAVTPSEAVTSSEANKETETEAEPSPPPAEKPDNPIDAFFDAYGLDDSTSSNAHMSLYREARADAWLAEAEHGYALLKELINPCMSDEGRKAYVEIIDRTRESFLVFAEDGTYLESTVAASNVFSVSDSDSNIFSGSAAGGYHLWLMGDMYRNEALRLYSMIESLYIFEECPELFVFDSEEFMSTVTEKYDIVLAPLEE